MVAAEVLRLAADPRQVDEFIKKRAAGEGGSGDGARSAELERLDGEISRVMDLYQYDQLIPVEEVAERLEKLHAERTGLLPSVGEKVKPFDVEGFKMILRDVHSGWGVLNVKGRRSFLCQLIDKVFIDAEEVSIDWSF